MLCTYPATHVAASPPWSSLRRVQVAPHTGKKTVLVTGGAGFIGSWVSDALLARGDDVVIVDEVRMAGRWGGRWGRLSVLLFRGRSRSVVGAESTLLVHALATCVY